MCSLQSPAMRDHVICYKFTDCSEEFAALLLGSVEYCAVVCTLKMEAAGTTGVAITLNRITSLKLVSFIVIYLKITNLSANSL